MTTLDIKTTELDRILLDVCRWPYRKERDAVLHDTMKFIAAHLGYDLITQDHTAQPPA